MTLRRLARRAARRLPWLVARPVAIGAAALGFALLPGILFVPLSAEDQLVFAIGCLLLFLLVNRIEGRAASAFLVVLSLCVTARYLHWRLTETIEPDTPWQAFFMYGLVLAEIYAGIAMFLGYFQTLWPLNRKPVPMPREVEAWPEVDVYVPTYNESLDVVRPTVLAALAMDWPPEKLKVWILDDGRRPEFRRFAEECGCGYIIRGDNHGAKAGNINHALKHTRAPFIAIFDCDHVATRAFLQCTLGWLIRDRRLAMVQTPHHFYSPDPFERNLTAGRDVPNEGQMFYGVVQPGNDLWDAAFFCGSCAVIRREALEEVGGVPHQTVTEDCHCSLKMQRRGWRTAYLRVPLASGLATERLLIHIGQRMRWARGMIQIFRVENPLLASGLRLTQRLCYFSATFYYLFAIPRLVFLTSPLAFLLLGQNVIAASPLAIAAYAGSHVVHAVGTGSRLSGRVRHSFWSEIYETVMVFYLLPLTFVTLLNPAKGKFNVTDKGGLLPEGYYDLRAVWPNMILTALLLTGVGFGIRGLIIHPSDSLEFQAYLLNGLWAAMCLVPVIAGVAVGRERRQIRVSARSRASVPVELTGEGGAAVAGMTRDLSLGGAAILLDGDAELQAGALRARFTLGDGEVEVPATVLRVAERHVSLSFSPVTLEDHGAIVRLVFSRADAWMEAMEHGQDRPLHSLVNVVRAAGAAFVGKTGLFRPVRRPAAAARAPAAAARPQVPRRTDVLPPRISGGGALGAALLACLLAGGAAAQSPVRIPQLRLPEAPVEGVQLPPAGAPQQPAPPQATAPAPPAAAPPAAAAPSPGVRHATLTLRQLGIRGPMQLRGVSDLQGVLFGLRGDEVVTEARLVVSGATSPALLPEYSQIAFTLNEQFIGAVQPDRTAPRFGPVEFPISPLFFTDLNRLNVRFSGRYTQECNDPLSGLLWANVSDLSALHLTIERLPMPRDLARLPEPFFDRRRLRLPLVLPFVLPGDASPEALRAAAIAASWFAVQAEYRGAQFPVAATPPAQGNAVVMVVGGQGAAGLELGPIEGPTLAVLPNPNDAFGQLLVVGGRNAAEAATAATALAFGRAALSGERALVEAPDVAPRRPYDAPRWISDERPVRFGELVDTDLLQASGFAPGPVTVPLRTAPDLYVARGHGIPIEVGFRAPPGPVTDIRVSRLDLSFSDFYLRSLPFRGEVGPWPLSWLLARFGWPAEVQRGSTEVPPYLISGQNEVQLRFDMRPLHRGDCAAVPSEVRASIDPDSTIDLSRAHRFAVLPNLAFFAGAGFPFTRLADLSETAIVLPDRPNAVEMSAFLEVVGRLAATVGLPATGLAVVGPSRLQEVAERNLILLGPLGRQPALNALLREGQAPVRLEGTRLALALPTPLENFRHALTSPFGLTPDTERQRAAARLASLPEGFGALLGFESPLASGRSVVALVSAVPAGLQAVLATLRDPQRQPLVQGDVVLVTPAGVEAFRSGRTYWHGSLPLWLWPEFYLGTRPLVMLPVLALACLLIALPLRRALRARAARRLRERSS
ncbi:UDP-forming cellulose synthase catalytic subunit [Siccirubricoccus phaeus]|uniref:UDP-forming cellulose synthase catalytic subunit n=1 Tax=Siccirubricoccus phaeus TaxID=2595053 RepID=UPI0011F2CA03|nr:UDP-forming cellulose synthase catalytic subunit [Siccirubricoccus phaeus]